MAHAFVSAFVVAALVAGCGSSSFSGESGKKDAEAKPSAAKKPPVQQDETPTKPGQTLGDSVEGDEPAPSDKPDDDVVTPPVAPPPSCDEGAPRGPITFETSPGGSWNEGQKIDDQFLASHGVRFSLEGGGFPVLARRGGSLIAYYCEAADCSARENGLRAGESGGSYMLTTGPIEQGMTQPLVITYANPVAEASGAIIDVDRDERWEITALDAAGQVVASQVLSASLLASFDGRPAGFALKAGATKIAKIRFAGSRLSGGTGIGLAFDDFSPAKACN